jgi:primosomal protein N' (replication factor Y)
MILKLALDTPLPDLIDYRWTGEARIGQRAIVPWGRQTVMGLVVECVEHSDIEPARLKDAIAVLDDVAPLDAEWFRLLRFAASYYQRPLGEVALPAIPALLRRCGAYRMVEGRPLSRSMTALRNRLAKTAARPPSADCASSVPVMNAEQAEACARIEAAEGFTAFLLHGITGSGKTEVYMHAIKALLSRGRQVLVLVPEINLTPQLEQLFRGRFPLARLASLHSGLADGERALQWLAAHEGQADIVLGTRMAVLAPMPRLGLIVVDEEHDPSYKQQEGLRYSARDLAVVRARQAGIGVILGSATPSLESWVQAQRGKYTKLALTQRASTDAQLPLIRVLNTERVQLDHGFTLAMREAIGVRLARQEQVLIFHNRRGYAPVLSCGACGWLSPCTRCSAHTVFHKNDGRLHCHHCGWEVRVPRACPDCGNVDLAPLGRGTQRVEEALASWYPAARVLRIDRDSTRRKGSAPAMLAAVHAGDVDILVGTQMVAKGHDFRNLTLVGVIDADSALFSADFRAAERLFANLMQVAGRSGRADKPGEVLIQTRFARHPVFVALTSHDYPRFAAGQISDRRAAGLPPFSHQVILRAEAKTIDLALAFLVSARELAASADATGVVLYDPVPMSMVRIANVERAQLLLESSSRPALQAFLPGWISSLRALRSRVSWHVEVDPLEI